MSPSECFISALCLEAVCNAMWDLGPPTTKGMHTATTYLEGREESAAGQQSVSGVSSQGWGPHWNPHGHSRAVSLHPVDSSGARK